MEAKYFSERLMGPRNEKWMGKI